MPWQYIHLYTFIVLTFAPQVILVESRHTGQKYIFKVLYKSLQSMAAVGKGKSKVTTNRTPVSTMYTVLHMCIYIE